VRRTSSANSRRNWRSEGLGLRVVPERERERERREREARERGERESTGYQHLNFDLFGKLSPELEQSGSIVKSFRSRSSFISSLLLTP